MTDDEIMQLFILRGKRTVPKRARKLPSHATETQKPATNRGGNAYRFTKSGVRSDLRKCSANIRSGWEADFLRVLEAYEIPYVYEPIIFKFPLKQRATRFYIPDVHLLATKGIQDYWVEIKGRLDPHSITKLRRFKRYHPEEFAKLIMIIKDSKECRDFCHELDVPIVILFKDVKRLFADKITNWESLRG